MAAEKTRAGLANKQTHDVATGNIGGSFWNKPTPPIRPQPTPRIEDGEESDERPE